MESLIGGKERKSRLVFLTTLLSLGQLMQNRESKTKGNRELNL